MRRNGSASETSLSSTLERLLQDLSKLETCTTSILDLVNSVLRTTEVGVSQRPQRLQTNGKATRSTRTPAQATRVAQPAPRHKSNCSARDAQRIVKTCLASLRDIKLPRPEVELAGQQKVISARNVQIKPKVLAAGDVLAITCTAALNSWTQNSTLENKDRIAIAKTRFNLSNRLLDLNILHTTLDNLNALHSLLCLNPDKAKKEVQIFPENHVLGFLRIPSNDFTSFETTIVSSSQLLVLRYLQLTSTRLDHNIISILQASDGPLAWCNRTSQNNLCDTKYLSAMNRQLLKMATLVSDQVRMQFYITLVHSLMDDPEENLQVTLTCLCRALEEHCTHEYFEEVECMSQQVLVACKKSGNASSEQARLALCDRMIRLSQRLNKRPDAERWLSIRTSFETNSTTSVSSILDRCVLKTSHAASVEQCITAMLDSTKSIETLLNRNDIAIEDARLVLRSMSNLRLSTLKCVKTDPKLKCLARNVLSGLVDVLIHMMSNSAQQFRSPSHRTLISTVIYSWLSTVDIETDHPQFSVLLQQAESCRKLCDLASLAEESQATSVNLFNWSGALYNCKRYKEASVFLSLYFQWNPPTSASINRLEYLWSAYLRCDEHEKAFTWLLHSLELTSIELNGGQEFLAVQLRNIPDVVRVSSKLLQLSKDHPRFTICVPLSADNATQAIFLELLLSGLTQMKHDAWCLNKYKDIVRELLTLYTAVGSAQTRLLSLAISYFYTCADRSFLATILSWAAELIHIDIGLEKLALSEQIYCLRINAHRVLLHTDTLMNPDTLLETAIFVSTGLDCQKDSELRRFCLQVLSEMQDIFTEIHMPVHSIKAIHLLLHVYEQELGSSDQAILLRLHTLAAEQYLACGYDGRAMEHLLRASKIADDCDTSPRISFDRAVVTFKHAAITNSRDLHDKLLVVGNLLTKVPKMILTQCRIIFLQCLSNFAESVGHLGQAVILLQEALSTERRCISQRISNDKSVVAELEDEIADDFQHLSLVPAEVAQNQSPTSSSLADISSDLGRLCEKAGLIKDALYYRNQALDVSKKLANINLINRAQLSTNLLRYRAGLGGNKCLQDEPQTQNPLEAVLTGLAGVEMCTDRDVEVSENILLMCEAKLEKALEMDFRHSMALHSNSARPTSRPETKKSQSKGKRLDSSNLQLEQTLARLRCNMLVSFQTRNQTSLADAKFSQIASSISHQSADGIEIITMAKYRLRKAEASLSHDPVFSALHDSALSLPSVCAVIPASASRHRQKKATESITQAATSPFLNQVLEGVTTSTGELVQGLEHWVRMGDSLASQKCGHLYNTLSLLQAALRTPTLDKPFQSLTSNYFMENAKALPIYHERRKRSAEVDTVPISNVQDKTSKITFDPMPERSEFQTQFIDIIPKNWVTVSISLSPCGTSLVLSRIQATKNTLILRLPMSRHASRDVNEETFEFQDAKRELRDIIAKSDLSAQEAKFIKDKSGKAKWWALRQELDERLATLVENIEHCWLGGFLGIFGSDRESSSEPAQFRNALARIILKHVPLKPTRSFDIDSRILDLFLDLDQLEEDRSLEVLEDLLYFVLDIYQFHGESIAYDEIDIDQMVVDIQVALSAYHAGSTTVKTSHTVLILDRSLHIFPWESLPCLKGRSISRVPSLSVLKDLLEQQSGEFVVPRGPGRYILNPSSDLKTTEKTLHAPLQSLPEWSGIVGRKPEEVEMISFLEDSSVFIYFGHGGGEQYIRGSKVKKLKSCGVVILMGCSSGALKEQGIFDPWGTPYNYCVANCPSLVVNLWDVTDKDIDRFSLKMLSKWSLTATEDKACSICEAVAQSRDECVLRYLNGAAPVVYGLPLSLAPRT